MRFRRWLVLSLVLSLALLLLGVALLLAAGQYLIHPERADLGPPPADLAAEAVTLTNQRGETVKGWLVPGRTGRGLVLLLHGVHGDRRSMLPRARFLHQAGYGSLLIDFPGHGESTPSYKTFGHNESASVQAALAWLRQRFPNEKVAIIGVSMGAAATVLARPAPQVDGVVLEAMYPSIEEATADRLELHLGSAARPLSSLLLWQLPVRLGITPEQLRPEQQIGQLKGPLMLIGGTHDLHTKAEEIERLYAKAAQPKTRWMVEGAPHTDFHLFDKIRYEQTVLGFLGRTLGSQ